MDDRTDATAAAPPVGPPAARARVVLIGGGPGAPDLVTVRAARVLAAADVVIWGRPFASEALVGEHARAGAEIVAWPPATMRDIHAIYDRVLGEGLLVARLYSGDTSVFSHVGDEIAALEERGVAWEVVPGITAYAAAAAHLGRELTEGSDWRPLVVTSLAMLDRAAATGEALAVYMTRHGGGELQQRLLDHGYPHGTRCVVAHRVGWPEASVVPCVLAELAAAMSETAAEGLSTVLIAPAMLLGAPRT